MLFTCIVFYFKMPSAKPQPGIGRIVDRLRAILSKKIKHYAIFNNILKL